MRARVVPPAGRSAIGCSEHLSRHRHFGHLEEPAERWICRRCPSAIIPADDTRNRIAGQNRAECKKSRRPWRARLAELLVEISEGSAAAKRRLRLELAAAPGPGEVAKEVRKRLTTLARSRSFGDWQGVRSLATDLDAQRRAFVETVAKTDPAEALDVLWRFMALAAAVFERCDDSNGVVIGVFHQACRDLGEVASSVSVSQTTISDRAYEALVANDYGQFGGLISVLAPALGQRPDRSGAFERAHGRAVEPPDSDTCR